MTYEFLQSYWWCIVSLLGALLVFLLFVQGGNSLIFCMGRTPDERRMVINSTGRKWEFTFTTLVTFGGAFFASFPLFYSTSFGGAYWVWMIILFSFVVQAVSYEFQNKIGNFLGPKTFQSALVINGIVGPLLLGAVVGTFFTGSNFMIAKQNITDTMQPIISQWANASGGLDVLCNPWNWILGLAVFFLSRVLGLQYMINSIDDAVLGKRSRKLLAINFVLFLVFFLSFVVRTLLANGYAVAPGGTIQIESYKYLHNLLTLWPLLLLFLTGVVLVLAGTIITIFKLSYRKGIWLSGIGTVLAVWVLLLIAGLNHTAYYPSLCNPQYSLTIANSCSSYFTLKVMFWVSMFVPFVLLYIFYAWRAIDKTKISKEEILNGNAY